jgi:chromate transport protein ChrA
MYQAGILIFGGGPVVIPLLRDYVVDPGWVSSRDFLLGLAIIQALPGRKSLSHGQNLFRKRAKRYFGDCTSICLGMTTKLPSLALQSYLRALAVLLRQG